MSKYSEAFNLLTPVVFEYQDKAYNVMLEAIHKAEKYDSENITYKKKFEAQLKYIAEVTEKAEKYDEIMTQPDMDDYVERDDMACLYGLHCLALKSVHKDYFWLVRKFVEQIESGYKALEAKAKAFDVLQKDLYITKIGSIHLDGAYTSDDEEYDIIKKALEVKENE